MFAVLYYVLEFPMMAHLKNTPCSLAFLLSVFNFKQSSTNVNAQPYLAIINVQLSIFLSVTDFTMIIVQNSIIWNDWYSIKPVYKFYKIVFSIFTVLKLCYHQIQIDSHETTYSESCIDILGNMHTITLKKTYKPTKTMI